MLQKRSYKKELLDAENIPFADIRQNMKELDVINKWLGGHSITVQACKKLAKNKKEVTVCEIGCGGGDNLLAIYQYCKKQNIRIHLIGIDIKEECISYAKSRNSFINNATWITSDYATVQFTAKPDIIFSSLFCHHFTEVQLVQQIKWMSENCTSGLFINDLHRHVLAYYAIGFLTRLFSSSYLVKNDAPLSVARGFVRKELQQLCSDAGLPTATITWKWAFRFVVMYKHE